ncbi:MAG: TIGR04013 family B12-binding domain/radical SAM domain-containing protein [Deferribacteraceae bacterium]|jgi:B12-binding domain/radical SAM domain protein|nr:TIGR04013 family B12-binding domain/radical SAM domain-containing protein [Deferribacteraceae bacterium]
MQTSIIFVREKRNKHSIRVIAAAFEQHFPDRDYTVCAPEDLLASLKSISARALILCSFNTSKVEEYFTLADVVKLSFPKVVLACGGPHPTARSADCLQHFDMACVGEGELAIKDIVAAFDRGESLGLVIGKSLDDLDRFPVFPRRFMQFGPIEITRGCPGRCHYCQTPQLFQGKVRHRSVDAIVADVEFCLHSKRRQMDVRFITSDATFYEYNGAVNLAGIETLLSGVRNAVGADGRIFYGSFPSEFDPSRVSPELVELMKRYCDNSTVVIGLQSGSDKLLKLMNRRATVDDAERAATLLTNAGYDVVIDLIFGLPYEDDKSLADTIRWIDAWKQKVTIHAHPFFPMPGSAWEHEQPSKVPEQLLRLLRSIEGSGKIFGKYL